MTRIRLGKALGPGADPFEKPRRFPRRNSANGGFLKPEKTGKKRLEFLEFKVGGLALRLLHADLANRRANGAVSVTLNAASSRALQAGPADRDTSLVSRICPSKCFSAGDPARTVRLLRRIHPELLREADALRQQDNES